MPRAEVAMLAAWHAAFVVGLGILVLLHAALGRPLSPMEAGALLVIALPGLAGLGLMLRDQASDRLGLVLVWGLTAAIVLALTGGASGLMSALSLMPLLAGVLLARPGLSRRLVLAGAAASITAVMAGLLASRYIAAPAPGTLWEGVPMLVLVILMALGALLIGWHRREAALERALGSLSRLEALMAGQPGLTVVLDASGHLHAAYGTAPPGLDVGALFDDGLIAAVHAPDRQGLVEALAAASAGLQVRQALFAPRVALDRRVQFLVRALGDEEGRLIATLTDATLQHARELTLEAERSEALSDSAGKTRFLANMSHELRTPLNAVLGFSDMMRQRLFGPLPDKYVEHASAIHEAGTHLLDLINDVLDVSKIEARRYELNRERFDAREAITAAMTLIRVSAADKGVELAGVLPPEPLMVDADRRALKQVTLNLLSNAVKFTPRGGHVSVSAQAIGPYLELVVADTGVGIAPEDVARLGQPFVQVGREDQRSLGTGLGLSLVRALAELHQGRMTIESTLGEGTAVTVRLPVVEVARIPIPEDAKDKVVSLDALDRRGLRGPTDAGTGERSGSTDGEGA
ncbi:MAG: sensor histidine kinase [Brevundimonas sp.]|uniref:sensor histidine kinase n=1 Tax=Brevundimonas sp. TaxID=1871086 RepID=UPI003918763F